MLNGVARYRYREGVPNGFHVVSSYFVTHAGIVVFGSSWVPLVVAAAVDGSPGMLIPVVGPALGFILNGRTFGRGFSIAATLFVTTAQLVGASMIVIGLIVPRKWLERDVVNPSVSLVPTLGGVSLVGRY